MHRCFVAMGDGWMIRPRRVTNSGSTQWKCTVADHDCNYSWIRTYNIHTQIDTQHNRFTHTYIYIYQYSYLYVQTVGIKTN